MTVLQDAFEQFSAAGIKILPSEKNSKHIDRRYISGGHYNTVKGVSKFDEDETGYNAIIPPHILTIDVDVGGDKVGEESFKRLLVDAGLSYEPIPTTLTQSGGAHYYFENKKPGWVPKQTDSKNYPNLDRYSDYSGQHPIPGTSYGEGKGYSWHPDNIFEELVINAWEPQLEQVLQMREHHVVEPVEEESDEDYLLSLATKQPLDEVREMLDNVPSDCDYNAWMGYMASAYNLADDKKGVEKLLLDWSKTAESFDQKVFDSKLREIKSGRFGSSYKGGTLIKDAFEAKEEKREEISRDKYETYVDKIEEVTTLKELIGLFKSDDWKSEPHCTAEQLKALPGLCASRSKVLAKEDPKQKPKSVGFFKPYFKEQEPEEEKKKFKNIAAYLFDNRYNVVVDNKIMHEDFMKQSLVTLGESLKINGDVFAERIVLHATPVSDIFWATDYLAESMQDFRVIDNDEAGRAPILKAVTNPLLSVDGYIDDPDVITNFFDDVWQGKAKDLLQIIGLSIRFKQTKLNKIHIVAPSNTGKTALLENIGFQKFKMNKLIGAMEGVRGVGREVIVGLRKSGLLLIDEANTGLPTEIKDLSTTVQIDQFGKGGTQIIPLHFTCMTSTHKTAVRGMSDEMFSRLLLVEIPKNNTVLDHKNKIFWDNQEHYTEVVQSYCLWLLKDAITNPDYSMETYEKLIANYRLELNDGVGELLTDVSSQVIDDIKQSAGAVGEVIIHRENYYIQTKKSIRDRLADRLGEHNSLDVGKYTEVLYEHFVGEDAKRKSIKIDGQVRKYYQLNMSRYYETEEEEIIDIFDDLTEEENWKE